MFGMSCRGGGEDILGLIEETFSDSLSELEAVYCKLYLVS